MTNISMFVDIHLLFWSGADKSPEVHENELLSQRMGGPQKKKWWHSL